MTTPNQIVDHTLLAPTATPDEIEALCRDARDNRFYSVCVSPTYVARAASLVEGSDVHVCTVVGFPSGAHTSAVKAYETRTAVDDGADEIDMVMNLASAKAHDWAAVENDIRAVVEAAQGRVVKVILETCVLEDDEIVAACTAARAAGADFVKTSTGFAGGEQPPTWFNSCARPSDPTWASRPQAAFAQRQTSTRWSPRAQHASDPPQAPLS